jgi:hypothetical protein
VTAVLLGNIDYRRHMTNEGDQFQEGLRAAGWILAGPGYDGLRDVPAILDASRPDRVIVHDKRDWDPRSDIAFRKDLGFTRLGALADFRGFTGVVIKDAASSLAYQRDFYQEVGADAAIVYYHPRSVTQHGPWLVGRPLVRTYHSIAAEDVAGVPLDGARQPAIVSGALAKCYPLRQRVVRDAAKLGIEVLRHPGYGHAGTHTPQYLRILAHYRVHIATASTFGFALRKIIESVAMGCTVVTDLPAYDVLPEIDGALVRVRPEIGTAELKTVIDQAIGDWDYETRLGWAMRARWFYDVAAIGARLDRTIAERRAQVA